MRAACCRVLGLVASAATLLMSGPAESGAQQVQAVPSPSNVKAESVSPSRIDVSWTRVSTSLIIEYRVYRANGTRIARIPRTQSTYSDTGLDPWTEYSYYVTGVSFWGGESGPSNVATARTRDGTAPSAPGGFQGAATSPTTVELVWNAAADSESGVSEYVLYRDGSEIGRTSQLSYSDGSLQPDREYAYRVSAINGEGTEGPTAGPVEITTLKDKPGPPRDLTATARGPDAVDLGWRPPEDDDDIDGYRVYRDGSAISTTSGTDFEDTGLAPFTRYEYRVTSLDEDGRESDPSNAAVVTTPDGTPPTTPANLSAAALSSSQIELTWSASDDPESGISGYLVYRDGSQIGTTTATSYLDEGLEPATTYEYRVSAVNGDELEGEPSAPASAATPDDSAPTVPADLLALAVSFEQIDLSWSESSDPESGVAYYRVFRDGAEVGTTAVSSYQDAGLVANTSYEYRVSAVNGEGMESGLSEPAGATTLQDPGPPAPTNLSATPLSQTQIELTWTESTEDVTGYNVYRDGAFVANVMTTSFVDTGLSPETTYRYAVAGVAGEVQGERTAEVDATTFTAEDVVPPAAPTGLRLIAP